VDAQPDASSTRLAGGRLLAAISTGIVAILRNHYGRGPMKAKTYALDGFGVIEVTEPKERDQTRPHLARPVRARRGGCSSGARLRRAASCALRMSGSRPTSP
jgi:hypothetical protein